MFSNKRKVVFEVECIIRDLENLPYITGNYFVKWKLKGNQGYSEKATVRNNVVEWNSRFVVECTMKIGKDGVLEPCEVDLKFRQDVEGGRRFEEIGRVWMNLAEMADSRTTDRRYLLQESKLNTFVRLTVNLRLIHGDPEYKVPIAEKDIGDSLLSDAPGSLHRGVSISLLMKSDQEKGQDGTQELKQQRDVLSRRQDDAAIDDLFAKAKLKSN